MMSLIRGKRIVLAVTGGIAAYKTPILVRLLKKAGAEVKVIMTPAALDFVTPLTLSTLSGHPVHSKFTEKSDQGDHEVWVSHVALALWMDFMIIAPATAHTLSKMANGHCDNLVLAVYLSSRAPIYIAPAMDLDMYMHSSTKESLSTLEERGHIIIPAGHGELASGLFGQGRMAEPEEILNTLHQDLLKRAPLYGKKVLISAGPTFEPIDPVRYIGNHSSGKMGSSLAEYAKELGADVCLVLGPSTLVPSIPEIEVVRVTTAEEMLHAMKTRFDTCDITIMSAAVADYRPASISKQKIKKGNERLQIDLVPNTDILATLGKQKKNQILVGFALESERAMEFAKQKLVEKNLDLIVINSLGDPGAGFGGDTNKVSILEKDASIHSFELKPKSEVAKDIFEVICKRI